MDEIEHDLDASFALEAREPLGRFSRRFLADVAVGCGRSDPGRFRACRPAPVTARFH